MDKNGASDQTHKDVLTQPPFVFNLLEYMDSDEVDKVQKAIDIGQIIDSLSSPSTSTNAENETNTDRNTDVNNANGKTKLKSRICLFVC